LPAGKE